MTTDHGLRSEFATADDSTGLMLWRVTNAWQAAQRRALKPFELTHVQFVLLASLTWHESDATITQGGLAERVGTDPMMTSQVLRALEIRGLVERSADPNDARAKLLAATARGRHLAYEAVAVVEACDRDFFQHLDADRDAFTRMLARLV